LAEGFRKITSFETVSSLWSRRDTRPIPPARYRSLSSLILTSIRPETMPSTAFNEPSRVVAMSVTRSPGLTFRAEASPVPRTTPSPPSADR